MGINTLIMSVSVADILYIKIHVDDLDYLS